MESGERQRGSREAPGLGTRQALFPFELPVCGGLPRMVYPGGVGAAGEEHKEAGCWRRSEQ